MTNERKRYNEEGTRPVALLSKRWGVDNLGRTRRVDLSDRRWAELVAKFGGTKEAK